MTKESQPQGNVEPAEPPPDPAPAPAQADPATPITAPDPRLIDVKEFSEQPDAMTLTGDGAPHGGGGDDG